jgi:DNA-directed RNA polymerase subunit RPC12/RpoP
MSKKVVNDRQQKSYTKCPHCGQALSPWEQVLLSVDRVLTCRHCWYRILIEIKPDESQDQHNEEDKKNKG